ncbi:MAG: hypothetical protein JW895_05760 [Thermoleophilaceae bacterium]|nr:hypothetical protein [Thermoleophilaceae bacterium]
MASLLALAMVLVLATAGTAAAHHGDAAAVAAGPGTKVSLRSCFLTAVFVPREAAALQPFLRRPVDLSMTFYGPDPLLGLWGFSCEGARVAGKPVGRVTASLVSVPTGLTSAEALPLANNFASALVRMDTTSRPLARAFRKARLRARVVRKASYRHSPAAAVPWHGRLAVRDGYTIAVRARELDPTNPHDHANRFDHLSAQGRAGTMSLAIQNALDRFCLPEGGSCTASVKAERGSLVARLIGGREAPVRAGFDHSKLPRVTLVLRR